MDVIEKIVGSDPETIVWWQMLCRGIVIFFYALLLIRFGSRRVFGKYTSFDIVLAVILGSTMSRALTANAALIPTLVVATALVLIHRLLAALAYRSKRVANLIKGKEVLLVEDGHIRFEALRKTNMTENDLWEALRSNGGKANLADVEAAYLERSGTVSVVGRSASAAASKDPDFTQKREKSD